MVHFSLVFDNFSQSKPESVSGMQGCICGPISLVVFRECLPKYRNEARFSALGIEYNVSVVRDVSTREGRS